MVDRERIRQGYDDVASAYAAERVSSDGEREILDGFLESLPASPRVLDAGCGSGTGVPERLDDGAVCLGIDLSREQLRRAVERVPEHEFAQGDLAFLPAPDGWADAVTALHSLIHVPPAVHREAIAEFARVLEPGGRVLLTDGSAPWEGTNPDWLDSGAEMAWHVAGLETTRETLRNEGFAIRWEREAVDELADDEATWVYVAAELETDADRPDR
ncbi:class I SAM-dependent methyltransferase [Halopiger goleimassiliensis]|uniref:class I SAM-dependent methyltransferase n=1 Tax=Halopiger goleimassiliensis TaxID=1293048 RepID=UPI000677FAF9|nr:class I SAM-dependent methyltransferase [Halopiger goleimassiliensis]